MSTDILNMAQKYCSMTDSPHLLLMEYQVDEITVHVTPEDIANGLPNSMNFCPIALAARRELKPHDIWAVTVGIAALTIYPSSDEFWQFQLPQEAWEFVRAFDNSAPVEEFKFTARKTNAHKSLPASH